MGSLLEKSGDQDPGREREAKDSLTLCSLPPPSNPAEQPQSPRQASCLILWHSILPLHPPAPTREGCSISTCASSQWDVGVKVPGPRPLGLEVALATVSVVMLHRAGSLLVGAMQEGVLWPRKACRPNLDMAGCGPRTNHCLAWLWCPARGEVAGQRGELGPAGIGIQKSIYCPLTNYSDNRQIQPYPRFWGGRSLSVTWDGISNVSPKQLGCMLSSTPHLLKQSL